jgi:transaldolase
VIAMTVSQNALQQLHDAGQSIWLDYIDRKMLHDGDLERRILDDALTGMTSNPTMFEKALVDGTDYDDQIRYSGGGITVRELFERIATSDVRDACDLFRPVYERTGGADGYVSIEVSPELAYESDASVAEASRLWAAVDRPNTMIKIPGTIEGLLAIRELTAAGINVNITLLFSREMHRLVIDAYMSGLEDRMAAGKPLATLRSVASFFVSRVDVEVDRLLENLARRGSMDRDMLSSLLGRTGIANAKLAYQLFRTEFSTPRWKGLAAHGANVQRPLWASTGVKNSAYRDVMYVEALIGTDTVVTMPPKTLDAFRDHGVVACTVNATMSEAERALERIERAGISMHDVTTKLLTDGIASFEASSAALLHRLKQKAAELDVALADVGLSHM